jgi:S-DNA-T family DNA segregation ATPase FtsK/SpoIIIE
MEEERLNEIKGIVFLCLAIIVLVSLVSYSSHDLPLYTSHPNIPLKNYIRIFGAYISGLLFFFIGWGAYLVPILLLFWALNKFLGKEIDRLYIKSIGSAVLFLAFSALLSAIGTGASTVRFRRGGLIGLVFSDFLIRYFGRVGTYIILITLSLLSILLATEFLIFPLVLVFWDNLKLVLRKLTQPLYGMAGLMRKKEERGEVPKFVPDKSGNYREESPMLYKGPIIIKEKKPKFEPKPKAVVVATKKEIDGYKLPSLNLLDSPPPIEERKIKDDLQANARILEGTLSDFGIEAKVVEVERGPVITRYELEPAPGVKIQRIVALSDDIALVMKAQSVRIVAPIPGKARVGVEVPNTQTTLVYLKEVLESNEFQSSGFKLTLALGKDISGNPVVADLGDMPHLLIAGTTGSGKTVCVNALITSILFNATPDEVKFLMVDPKMVELAIFNGIPQLLCPVVTEPKKVSAALNWVVNEMEERYRLFAKKGVRNIEAYNEKAEISLPYIIIIIDELADLMAVASQDIENAITRLAQLSRAVGIHIVLATQRPSVDVVTGVIKANFPARVSFQVATKVDSRTVLDTNGADKLLGKGDMLFLRPGTSKLIRAQGSLIQDSEIERVVGFIKSQREPEYNEEILREQEKRTLFRDFSKDELFDEAVRVVLETGQASVSILQRRLGLGYTRAARLIDAMEQEGIVGPYRGSKPREILIKNREIDEPYPTS